MLTRVKGLFKTWTWKTYLVNLGLMIVVLFTLIFLFFYAYLPSTTRHGETITVPDLKGMALEDMDEFLRKRRLEYEVSDSIYYAQYPTFSIYKQYPLPGAFVKEKRKIYLTIIKKTPDHTKMPDLNGTLKNAELILESYGLERGKITYKPDLASNAVLEQWHEGKKIAPGTSIEKGSKIDLVVGDGLGNRTFEVPRFIGLPIDEAEFSIRASGLTTGSKIIRVLDDFEIVDLVDKAKELNIDTASIVKSGNVFQQRPEIGTEIRLGQQVDVWIVSLSEEDSLSIIEDWKEQLEENDLEDIDEQL